MGITRLTLGPDCENGILGRELFLLESHALYLLMRVEKALMLQGKNPFFESTVLSFEPFQLGVWIDGPRLSDHVSLPEFPWFYRKPSKSGASNMLLREG